MKGAKPDAWMPLFIGDYQGDTARLTTEQHGAYLLLIMDYWRAGPPPDDDLVLAQITLLERRVWLKHRPTLARFFTIIEGEWRHKRIDRELVRAQEQSDKAATRAQIAARARWKDRKPPQDECSGDAPSIAPRTARRNARSKAKGVLEECPSPSPSPVGKNSAPPGQRVLTQPGVLAVACLEGATAPPPLTPEETEARKAMQRELRELSGKLGARAN